MPPILNYAANHITNGLSRIEMLIELYERAILHLEDADSASRANDPEGFQRSLWQAERFLFGIVSGIDPQKDAVAANIARLLHFVLQCIEKRDFVSGVRILAIIRDGFKAIEQEAIELEAKGLIPALHVDASFIAKA